jgi:hypothetical protein
LNKLLLQKTKWKIQYTQGHIVIDVRHVRFDMSDNRSDGDRCNKKGHKTKELRHTNPTKSLPTMTQKSKDWATRTPLKVYQHF